MAEGFEQVATDSPTRLPDMIRRPSASRLRLAATWTRCFVLSLTTRLGRRCCLLETGRLAASRYHSCSLCRLRRKDCTRLDRHLPCLREERRDLSAVPGVGSEATVLARHTEYEALDRVINPGFFIYSLVYLSAYHLYNVPRPMP